MFLGRSSNISFLHMDATLRITLRLKPDKVDAALERFNQVKVLGTEIKQTREIIAVKLCEQKFLNAAMHSELLAVLIRRFEADVVRFLDSVQADKSEDNEVWETLFFTDL